MNRVIQSQVNHGIGAFHKATTEPEKVSPSHSWIINTHKGL